MSANKAQEAPLRSANYPPKGVLNGTPSSPSSFIMSEQTLATVATVNKIFDVYIPPLILVFGVTGNILAIIIMSRPRYNKLTTAFYMRVLAVFDTNLLTVVFVQHYLESNFANYVASIGFCKSFLFTDFTGFGFSNWILVAMTIDRFLAVQYPLKAPLWCTIKRAKWSTLSVFVYFVCTNIHVVIFSGPVFTSGENTLYCDIIGIPKFWKEAFYLYDMIITILVPFFVLLVLNIQIIRVVSKSNKQRNEMAKSTKNDNASSKTEQKERQLTTLLILVCIVFLVTSLPYAVDFIIWEHVIDYESDSNLEEIRNCSSSITYKFLYINPMINFYLYCMGCSKFRYELKMICYCKCCGCDSPTGSSSSEISAGASEG